MYEDKLLEAGRYNRQLVTREMLRNRGEYLDGIEVTEDNKNEIVGSDCLRCGWITFSSKRFLESCDCEGKECHHF